MQAMSKVYSAYDAKARFSDIMRRVRGGERVLISYRGTAVAEIRPLPVEAETFEQRLSRLEADGVVDMATGVAGAFDPVAVRSGALRRFLKTRD